MIILNYATYLLVIRKFVLGLVFHNKNLIFLSFSSKFMRIKKKIKKIQVYNLKNEKLFIFFSSFRKINIITKIKIKYKENNTTALNLLYIYWNQITEREREREKVKQAKFCNIHRLIYFLLLKLLIITFHDNNKKRLII